MMLKRVILLPGLETVQEHRRRTLTKEGMMRHTKVIRRNQVQPRGHDTDSNNLLSPSSFPNPSLSNQCTSPVTEQTTTWHRYKAAPQLPSIETWRACR